MASILAVVMKSASTPGEKFPTAPSPKSTRGCGVASDGPVFANGCAGEISGVGVGSWGAALGRLSDCVDGRPPEGVPRRWGKFVRLEGLFCISASVAISSLRQLEHLASKFALSEPGDFGPRPAVAVGSGLGPVRFRLLPGSSRFIDMQSRWPCSSDEATLARMQSLVSSGLW